MPGCWHHRHVGIERQCLLVVLARLLWLVLRLQNHAGHGVRLDRSRLAFRERLELRQRFVEPLLRDARRPSIE